MIRVFSCWSEKVRYLNVELIYTYSISQNNEPEESANSCFICRCILSSRPFRHFYLSWFVTDQSHRFILYGLGLIQNRKVSRKSEVAVLESFILLCQVWLRCKFKWLFLSLGSDLHSKICKCVCSQSHQWRIIPVHLWTLNSVCSFAILLWVTAWWVLFGGFI